MSTGLDDGLRPWTLVAELTYRCQLACGYCSNPIAWTRHKNELATDDWIAVFREAEALGVMQVHFTGGEPLLRPDLEALVAGARASQLYTHLVTSGVPLTSARLAGLRACGLDAIQLSIQDVDANSAKRIAGRSTLAQKLDVARAAQDLGLPLTVNVVLHRDNLARIDEFIALAYRLSAHRVELANVQYLGWALANRTALLPSREQVYAARAVAAAARASLVGVMEVVFVMPDYHSGRPKPCMDGWGRRYIVVTPDGLALPCHAAHTIPTLRFDDVRHRPLGDIWAHSDGFAAFRGEEWMPEPCRTCPERVRDFGGCRCQAYHLTGKAMATDPACSLSPHHDVIVRAAAAARTAPSDAIRRRRMPAQ